MKGRIPVGLGPRHVIASALVVLAAALLASGCGGDGETTTAPTTPEAGGGEKSIEEFGAAAGGEDRAAILAAFEGLLGALGEEDFAGACGYISASARRSFQQFAAGAKKRAGCAQILATIAAPTAATIAREQLDGEVARVRVEGEQAFVVFRAPGAKLYMLGLVREGDEWKATTAFPSVLVPDL